LATRTKQPASAAPSSGEAPPRAQGAVIESHVDPKSGTFQKNTRVMADRVAEINAEEERIRQGGGAKAIENQHAKNRLTARERIARLIDPKTDFFELSIFAAY
jgi:3-methylcrotonyl-CoA carboxylase beta subunit